jgi:serine/threonine protein phosphatase PrpC
MAPSAIWLLGRDYTEFGTLGLVAHPGGGALALSRGLVPKPYAHTDPNEDVALLVHADPGALLAVADGFNGAAASEIALETLHEQTERLLVQDAATFDERVRELFRSVSARTRPVLPSRTCLVLMAVVDGTCHAASFGDSTAFRAHDSQPLLLENTLIPGPNPSPHALAGSGFTAHFKRAPGERVAVVSDGITNFVPDPERIPTFLEEAQDDVEAAQQIAESALRGGAGDNVAVVVYGGSAPVSA